MKYLFILLLPLFVVAGTLVSVSDANAAIDMNSIIDDYSDPKDIDDYYYIQESQLNVKEFTTRTLADYLRGNDTMINGYSVTVDTGNSSTCDPSDWINAGNRLVEDKFLSYQSDYYASGQGRLLYSAIFSTYHDVSDTSMVFGSTLHAFNNRGVYKGGFFSNGTQDMTRITVVPQGSGITVYCYNGPANTSAQWQGSSVPQGSAFILGYLYDNWYPDDATGYNLYFLNHLPPNTTVTYPEDYTGEGLPDFPPIHEGSGNPDPISTAPNWYISNIFDNKAKFHDQNFNTFDGNPFLCEGDLAPVLYWEIFRVMPDDQEILITSGYQSATAEINYDFGSAETDRDYIIVGWYDCGDNTPFPNQGRAEFTITRAGLQKIDLFEACIKPEFPWVDPDACLNNVYVVINMLYFGQVALPNFTFDPSCRNLVMMDEWLGLPNNYQVCPQIPAFVRNVTTPFVAFMLGLVTLGFIKKIRTDFDG